MRERACSTCGTPLPGRRGHVWPSRGAVRCQQCEFPAVRQAIERKYNINRKVGRDASSTEG